MTVDLLTLGETMVSARTDSLLRLGGTLSLSIAGAESNVATAMARLGHRTRWVGRVGDDEFGALVVRTLRAESVDVAHVVTVADRLTGMLLLERAPAGRTRVHYRRRSSAATTLEPGDVDAALRAGARLLHVTGITPALGDSPARTVRHALETAHTADVTTCLDVNFRRKLWSRDDAGRALRPLIPWVDILVASEDELPLVADGLDDAGRAGVLLSSGVREVVVKRGAAGATVYAADCERSEPALSVPVVDTVGAGDAFTAGYLSGLLDGLALADRLGRAVGLGAAAVTAVGDWEGLPTRAELDQIGHTTDEALR